MERAAPTNRSVTASAKAATRRMLLLPCLHPEPAKLATLPARHCRSKRTDVLGMADVVVDYLRSAPVLSWPESSRLDRYPTGPRGKGASSRPAYLPRQQNRSYITANENRLGRTQASGQSGNAWARSRGRRILQLGHRHGGPCSQGREGSCEVSGHWLVGERACDPRIFP